MLSGRRREPEGESAGFGAGGEFPEGVLAEGCSVAFSVVEADPLCGASTDSGACEFSGAAGGSRGGPASLRSGEDIAVVASWTPYTSESVDFFSTSKVV